MKLLWRSAVVVALASCAPVSRPAEEPEPTCFACEELASEPGELPEPSEVPRAPALTLQPEGEERADRWATRSIGGATDSAKPARPPRRRRVDVSLLRAPFDDVARFLAEAGRFDVVLDAPSAREVTVSLHDVEPFEALELIAETQGLTVTYRRGVVIVSR